MIMMMTNSKSIDVDSFENNNDKQMTNYYLFNHRLLIN